MSSLTMSRQLSRALLPAFEENTAALAACFHSLPIAGPRRFRESMVCSGGSTVGLVI
jgi:hypothetical protein